MAHTLLTAGVTTITHPMAYAKTLIQIGYEPMSPIESKTMFGSQILYYPNVLKYIGHIRRTDGFLGLYRGLTPRLLTAIVNRLVSDTVSAGLFGQPLYTELSGDEAAGQPAAADDKTDKDKDKTETNKDKTAGKTADSSLRKLIVDTSCESLARCAGIVASQPFYVIVVRTMSEFVGRETKYSSVRCSISEIWQNEGILGFFSGMVPRLLGELLTIWLANALTHVVNNFMLTDAQSGAKELRGYSGAFSQLAVSQVTYPFVLVSTVMAVNDSGLMASSLCKGRIYSGWTDCWSRLAKQTQLKRGASMFFRKYTGATTSSIDGRLQPVMENLLD